MTRHRILIVEDEPIIAMEISQAVEEAGGVVGGEESTLDGALAALAAGQWDGVVLDSNLRGERANPIVERLTSTGIRRIIVSGYERQQLGFSDDHSPLILKPFDYERLVAAIRNHLIDGSA